MRRSFVAALAVVLVETAMPASALAQTPTKLPRVGILYFPTEPAGDPARQGFGRGMRELGYIDGRNVSLVWRYAAGDPARLPALAAELVALKLDVILAGGPGPFAALRSLHDATPIVSVGGGDPVGEGWASSLARPGGTMTGLSVTFPELGPKRLELAKEAIPGIARVAVLLAPAELPHRGADDIAMMAAAARSLGLKMQVIEAADPSDFERAIRAAKQGGAQALLTVDTTFILTERARVATLAEKERLPVIGEFGVFGMDGVLMAYGADIDDLLRRAASYVDRILKGARAGDLPVERPSKLDLIVNRRVARELGITLPSSLLARADRIVE